MDHQVIGTTMPVLEVKLGPGESVVAESGELSWMTSSINMHTATAKAGSKGVLGVVKRAVAGGSIFMTEYTAEGTEGMVAFATKVPGRIVPIHVDANRQYMVHRGGFLCAVPGVNLEIGFQQKLSAGFLGGEGFILQKISGVGDAWVEIDGELVEYDLGPDEVLRVHPGHVGLFDATVAFEITRIKGIKNMFFGGDGIFLAQLRGPGKVLLQTMPLINLAGALAPYIAASNGSDSGSGSGFSLGSVAKLIND